MIFKTQIICFLLVMLRVRTLTSAQQLCLSLDNLDNIFFPFFTSQKYLLWRQNNTRKNFQRKIFLDFREILEVYWIF